LLGQLQMEQGDWKTAADTLKRIKSHQEVQPVLAQAELQAALEKPLNYKIEAHTGALKSVQFSPDGRYAFSGGADGTIRVWDAGKGDCVQTFSGSQGGIMAISTSADGRFLLSGSSDGKLRYWDLSGGRCLHTFGEHFNGVTSAQLSKDGLYALASGNDYDIKYWKIAT
jgi:WD40 repeat protein